MWLMESWILGNESKLRKIAIPIENEDSSFVYAEHTAPCEMKE